MMSAGSAFTVQGQVFFAMNECIAPVPEGQARYSNKNRTECKQQAAPFVPADAWCLWAQDGHGGRDDETVLYLQTIVLHAINLP